MQRLPAITHDRFGLFRFRSPLLTESRLLSLPVGTEMFHFPTFPLPALYIQAGVTGSHCCAQRGFPIRKSSDQSSFINSPRLIADYYVLLRLQMPRHPPCALRNLISHEYWNRSPAPRSWRLTNDLLLDLVISRPKRSRYLRCSRPLCSSQITGGTLPRLRLAVTKRSRGSFLHPRGCRPGPSGPNSVQPVLRVVGIVPAPRGTYWMPAARATGHVNVPPMSYRLKTCASDPAPGRSPR